MITLKEINEDNFYDCIRLKVTEKQDDYIATNMYSLAEAYTMRNSLERVFPLGIYLEDKMIGFTQFAFIPYIEGDEEYDEQVFYMSRFMIDQSQQNKGYGKIALAKVIEFMKDYEECVEAIVLSCDVKNTVAYNLYASSGFADENEQDEDGDNYMRYIIHG